VLYCEKKVAALFSFSNEAPAKCLVGDEESMLFLLRISFRSLVVRVLIGI
jgi:hypothetical protein